MRSAVTKILSVEEEGKLRVEKARSEAETILAAAGAEVKEILERARQEGKAEAETIQRETARQAAEEKEAIIADARQRAEDLRRVEPGRMARLAALLLRELFKIVP